MFLASPYTLRCSIAGRLTIIQRYQSTFPIEACYPYPVERNWTISPYSPYYVQLSPTIEAMDIPDDSSKPAAPTIYTCRDKRRAWDTIILRAHAVILTRSLSRRKGIKDEPMLSAADLKSWRIVRLSRRYPEVNSLVSTYLDRLLSPTLSAMRTDGSFSTQRTGITESRRERKERVWRKQNFKLMTEASREKRAQTHFITGYITRAGEGEGRAESKLVAMVRAGKTMIAGRLWFNPTNFTIDRPKTGYSAPDSPYVKQKRYPKLASVKGYDAILWKFGNAQRRAQIEAWYTYDTYSFDDKRKSIRDDAGHPKLVTMFTDFIARWKRNRKEICTTDDRKQRIVNRAKRLLQKTTAFLAKQSTANDGQLSALESVIARLKAQRAMSR